MSTLQLFILQRLGNSAYITKCTTFQARTSMKAGQYQALPAEAGVNKALFKGHVKTIYALLAALITAALGYMCGAATSGLGERISQYNKYADQSKSGVGGYQLPPDELAPPERWPGTHDLEGVERNMLKVGPHDFLGLARGNRGPPNAVCNATALPSSPFSSSYSSCGGAEAWKMVLVVNMALKMGKGKMAAQCAHAAVDVVLSFPDDVKPWMRQGQAKVVVKGESEEELRDLAQQAGAMKLPFSMIHDAGRTQIAAGSLTVLAIGPGPVSRIDGLTKNLKLL
eukprot:g47206.t1